jgi:hypothetical protein
MKLPTLKSFKTEAKASLQPFDVKINVSATGLAEAQQMQEAIQSFVSHFSVTEMKSAAAKLKNPTNRKMIKTFL